MAKLKETTQERKLRRNKSILAEYNTLMKTTTSRKAIPLLAEMFSVSEGMVNKVLFDPTYSNSPLQQNVATVQTNTVPAL